MEIPEANWMTYAQARARQRTQVLRQSDVPIEHAVSLPIPTLRWASRAYAQFAAPASRGPDRPTLQSSADRWWVFDARSGQLIVYALARAMPLPSGGSAEFSPVEIAPSGATVAAIREQHQALEAGMELIVRDFFQQLPGDPEARRQAAILLRVVIPPPLNEQYQALAPDFFAWLDA